MRVVGVDQGAQTDAGLPFGPLLLVELGDLEEGRGSLVNSSLSRSMSMMSACLVIAQNGA